MRKKLYVTGAVIVIAVVAIIWQRIKSSEDEGPIIVKNGSIEIETVGGEWKDGNSEWINQTTGAMNANDLWVKVTSSTGTCRASGKPVHIQYSQPSVHVVFTSGFARDTARHPSGDGFLAKPFTIESLTGIVAEALS